MVPIQTRMVFPTVVMFVPNQLQVTAMATACATKRTDAKGLMKSAIREDGPVVYIQHRLLGGIRGEVPDGDWLVPLGQAEVKVEGEDVTVVATSYAVHKAMVAADELAGEVSVEVVDPRAERLHAGGEFDRVLDHVALGVALHEPAFVDVDVDKSTWKSTVTSTPTST